MLTEPPVEAVIVFKPRHWQEGVCENERVRPIENRSSIGFAGGGVRAVGIRATTGASNGQPPATPNSFRRVR